MVDKITQLEDKAPPAHGTAASRPLHADRRTGTADPARDAGQSPTRRFRLALVIAGTAAAVAITTGLAVGDWNSPPAPDKPANALHPEPTTKTSTAGLSPTTGLSNRPPPAPVTTPARTGAAEQPVQHQTGHKPPRLDPPTGASVRPSTGPTATASVDPARVTCSPYPPGVYACHTGLRLAHEPGETKVISADMQEWGGGVPDSDLWRDGTGLYTTNDGKIAFVDNRSGLSRAKCARTTGWLDRIAFGDLAAGSQLCMMTGKTRYASIVVRSLPAGPSGSVTLAGYTWLQER